MGLFSLHNCCVSSSLNYLKLKLDSKSHLTIPEFSGYHCISKKDVYYIWLYRKWISGRGMGGWEERGWGGIYIKRTAVIFHEVELNQILIILIFNPSIFPTKEKIDWEVNIFYMMFPFLKVKYLFLGNKSIKKLLMFFQGTL